MVMAVMGDGIPRSVRMITSEVSKTIGKKQKQDSINVRCSMLTQAGVLKRVGRGVYQKVA